jgi:GTP:adenosylcobinamide-phosphate guanylyltransferase
MSRKALVLAAGTGTRLHPLTRDTAKCVLDVGGTTSIRYLLERFAEHGIDEAIIVVGWQADQVRAAAASVRPAPRLRFIDNPHYDFHGCECSMSLAHEALADARSLLIVEADLLMPGALFRAILDEPAETAVLLGPGPIDPTRSVVALGADGVVSRFVYDPTHRDVLALVPDPRAIVGESLQVWKFGGRGLAQLIEAFRAFQAGLGDAPDPRNGLFSINAAIRGAGMLGVTVDSSAWINLNTVADLERARGASWLRPS